MKTVLTSLDILAIVKELKSALISARIENVYQLEDGSFLLKLRTTSGAESLIVEPSRRLNITRFKYRPPEKPSPAATYLRRLILSAKVEDIGQVDFDRILFMSLSRGGTTITVYFEIFGNGNLVVVEGGRTKWALESRSMKDRVIKLNVPYSPPPQRGIDPMKGSAELGMITSMKADTVRSLVKVYNLPPEVVEESLYRSSISPSAPASALTKEDLARFEGNAKGIISEVSDGRLQPNIVEKGGAPISVLPIEFLSMPSSSKRFESFNEAVDEYFSKVKSDLIGAKRRSPIEEEIAKLEAVREMQASHIKQLEDDRRAHLETGLTLKSNMAAVQEIVEGILEARKRGVSWGDIMKESFAARIASIDPSKGTAKASIGEKEVLLDFKISAAKNAEAYFEKSKEAAKKLEGLKAALKETEGKLEKARAGLMDVKPPIFVRALKKEWYERFRWSRTTDGTLILGGKDSTQNEVLVKKHMGPDDVFVHADVPGGSTVIIKTEGRPPTDEALASAASLAVAYSRAWKSGITAADAYWVRSEQVTKTPPSGEYLGKGAFMIYGERNYLRGVPLSVCLGIQIEEGGFRLIIGSEAFVKSSASAYVRIRPGEIEGAALCKRIKEALSRSLPEDSARIVKAISDAEIMAILPTGGCSVD